MIETNFQGIIEKENLSNEQYHETKALSSSIIKEGNKSFSHVKAVMDGKKTNGCSQSRFDLGTVAHSLCLEQDTSKFVCGPECSSKAVKIWKDFVDSNPGKIILTPYEYSQLMELFEKYCSHKFASLIVDRGKIEQSHFTIDPETRLWIKARPDVLVEDSNFIVDYKTATSARPNDFSRAIANYGYGISAAHYMEVVQQTTGIAIENFFWIVQEIRPPYEIMVFRASKDLIERSKAERRYILSQIKQCTEKNEWPGYSEDIQEIDVPHYLINNFEPDFGG